MQFEEPDFTPVIGLAILIGCLLVYFFGRQVFVLAILGLGAVVTWKAPHVFKAIGVVIFIMGLFWALIVLNS